MSVVEFLNFFVNSFQRGIGVGTFAEKHDAGNHVVVIDELAILVADGAGELAEADFRALRNDGDIFHSDRSAVLRHQHCVLDIVHGADQAHFLHVDLLQAGLDETAAGVGVVICELLLHLADAQPIGNQFVGIEANLIFARRAAEAGHIDHVRDGLKILLDDPVFDRLQIHHVVLRVGAVQREEIDLADRTPVGAHLRHYAGGQSDLRKALQRPFAIPVVVFHIVEDQLDVRQAEQRKRPHVNDARNAVHAVFERNRDLLLDLLGGDARPLRDDFDVVIGNVGISFDRKLME